MSNFLPTISDALYALGIDGGWKIKEGEIVKWYSETAQPSDSAIDTKLKELVAEYDANQYQRDRAVSYPSVGDQLDMIYKDMKNSITTHAEAVEAVKTKFPKE